MDSVAETTADTSIAGLSGDVAKTVGRIKNADKLKAYLEKNGGTFDEDLFYQSIEDDLPNATRIQSAASTASKGVILLSLACMANEAFSHTTEIQNNNEKGASREGLQLMAATSQTKAGAVTSEAEQTAAKQLDGAEASPYYQYNTEQQVSTAGQNIPRVAINTSGNDVVKIVSSLAKPTNWGGGAILRHIPGLSGLFDSIDSKICGAVLSPGGAITIGTVDLVAAAAVSFFSDGAGDACRTGW